MRRARLLAAITVAVAGASVVSTSPASAVATKDSAGGGEMFVIPSSGSLTWDPRPGQGECAPGATIHKPDITQSFRWDTPARMVNIRDSGDSDTRSYEHEAQFAEGSPGNYDYTLTGTNIPNYYQDTDLDDTDWKRAGGSWRSKNFQPGVLYSFTLRLYKCGGLLPEQPIRVRSQRAYHNGPCWPDHAYCVTRTSGWPKQLMPYGAGYRASRTTKMTWQWNSNKLLNPTFASGAGPWTRRSAAGGQSNWAVYAGGYEAPNFLEFNCAGTVAGCSVYQDIGSGFVRSTDSYTFGTLVRCPANQPACPVSLVLWSLSQGAAAGRSYSVPADGQWYLLEMRGEEWASAWGYLRFEVYNNHPGVNLDIDQTLVHWTEQ